MCVRGWVRGWVRAVGGSVFTPIALVTAVSARGARGANSGARAHARARCAHAARPKQIPNAPMASSQWGTAALSFTAPSCHTCRGGAGKSGTGAQVEDWGPSAGAGGSAVRGARWRRVGEEGGGRARTWKIAASGPTALATSLEPWANALAHAVAICGAGRGRGGVGVRRAALRLGANDKGAVNRSQAKIKTSPKQDKLKTRRSRNKERAAPAGT